MPWNPNIPTVTNRVQDDLDAIRENFQHLDQLAERVDELQTVSELAPIANDLQTVSGLAPVAGELQAVSELAPYVQALLDSRIVEMGSNSNGTYVRWENGLQVCFIRRFGPGPSPVDWVLPAAFVDATYAVVGTSYDWPFLVVTVDWRDTTATRVRFRKWSHGGTEYEGNDRHISPIAIGRWK